MRVLLTVLFFCLFRVDGQQTDISAVSDIPKVTSVKKFENGQLLSESRYFYNLQGDITQERTVYFDSDKGVQDNNNMRDMKTYTYKNDNITMTHDRLNPGKSEFVNMYTSYFKVNAKGLATEKYYSFAGKYKFLYKYDSSDYRIYEKFLSYGSDTLNEYLEHYNYYAYIYSESCLIKEYVVSDDPNMDKQIEYTYFKDRVNTIGNENFGQGFLGASGRHPVSKQISSNHNGTYEQTYTYEYENGRIIKKMTNTTVFVYTYSLD